MIEKMERHIALLNLFVRSKQNFLLPFFLAFHKFRQSVNFKYSRQLLSYQLIYNHYDIVNMFGFNSLLIGVVIPIMGMVAVQTPNGYCITVKLAVGTDEDGDERREEARRGRRREEGGDEQREMEMTLNGACA